MTDHYEMARPVSICSFFCDSKTANMFGKEKWAVSELPSLVGKVAIVTGAKYEDSYQARMEEPVANH